MEDGTISTIDTIIVVAYLVGIMAVGILAGYRRHTSSGQFFLAGRSLRWPILNRLIRWVAAEPHRLVSSTKKCCFGAPEITLTIERVKSGGTFAWKTSPRRLVA